MEVCRNRHFALVFEAGSMKIPVSTLLHLLLISLGCLLTVEGLYLAIEKFVFTAADAQKQVAQLPAQKQPVAVQKKSAEDDVRIVLQRRLFGPPPSGKDTEESVGESIEDLQTTSLDLVLLGTIIGENEESRAIILEKAKKTQDIYQRGEMVQGAQLKEILRGKIILHFNDKDEILDMTEAAKYASKTPVAAASGVRQDETLPGPEQAAAGADSQAPVFPAAKIQPKSIRPMRRFAPQQPAQTSP